LFGEDKYCIFRSNKFKIMASIDGFNARGEMTIEEQKKRAREAAEQKRGFWEKQILAWSSLLKALRADQFANEEAKAAGKTPEAPRENIKLWWKTYWTSAIIWGVLILLVFKLAEQPPARNHHRKGSRYNP
jgi:hypothetical protein